MSISTPIAQKYLLFYKNRTERRMNRQYLRCAICVDCQEGKPEWKILPCGHAFHGDCFDMWMNRNGEEEKITTGCVGRIENDLKRSRKEMSNLMKENVALRLKLQEYKREAVRRKDESDTLRSEIIDKRIDRLDKRIDWLRTRRERQNKIFDNIKGLWDDILNIVQSDDDSDSDCPIGVAGSSNAHASDIKYSAKTNTKPKRN